MIKSLTAFASIILLSLPPNLSAFGPADLVGKWTGYRAEGRRGTVESWKSRMTGYVDESGAVRIVETSVWSIRITHVFREDGSFLCTRWIGGERLATAKGTWSAEGENIEIRATYPGSPVGRDLRGTFTRTEDGFEFTGRDQRSVIKPLRIHLAVAEKPE